MADNYDEFDAELEDEGRRRFSIVGILTALIAIAAVFVVVMLIYVLVSDDNFITDRFGASDDEPLPTLVPTLQPVPSATEIQEIVAGPGDSSESVFELPPTHTPVPVQATSTQVPINTLQPTLTPSVTPTFPPPTPTRTPTPTPTDTPTPGPSATATATFSPFPFTKDQNSPQYLQNFANSAGCNWMGVAGEVFNLEGNPVGPGEYVVHVWDSGIDQRVEVGGAPAYGPSGYEQFIFDAPRVQEQSIQLETSNGTAVSQVYRFQTRASCNQNLIWFSFVQNH
jgi:hypothetical protein